MKNRKSIIMLVVLLAIGFAAVSTALILNGTLNFGFNSSDFDVYFSDSFINGVNNTSVIKEDRKIIFDTDMSLVGEKYELEYFITNGSRNYDAEIYINCTDSNEYLDISNDFINGSILSATETTDGNKLSIVVKKPYVGTGTSTSKTFKLVCEIVATPITRDSLAANKPMDKVKNGWKLAEDSDNNGKVSKGDLITLESESFYVLNVDDYTVTALAKYNLYQGTIMNDGNSEVVLENPSGLQDSRATGAMYDNDTYKSIYPWVGMVTFTTDDYFKTISSSNKKKNDYDISLIKSYVDAYGQVLDDMNGNIKNIRLITKDELVSGGCNETKNSCRGGYAWNMGWIEDASVEKVDSYLYSTSYYTSSPYQSTTTYIWFVLSDGALGFGNVSSSSGLGIRPVIEISKSLFE